MHEVGVAASILESVEAEARCRPEDRFIAVGVRIGELSNVDKDALEFAFEALTRNTPVPAAAAVPGLHGRIRGARIRFALPGLRRRQNDLHRRHGTGRCVSGIGGAMREVVEKKILNENDRLAAELRQRYRDENILCVNIISSPGSGKTALLE